MQLYNVHTHVFTFNQVPENFLPLSLVRWLMKYQLIKPLGWLLNYINPFSSNDLFQRYSNLLKNGNFKHSEDIFLRLKEIYPSDTIMVALAMDFEYMGAGNCKESYEEQLKQVLALKDKYDHIRAFMAVDPRRPGIDKLVEKMVSYYGIDGLKLYPPLGFLPNDKRLEPIYYFAQNRLIPLTFHCLPGGVYGRNQDIPVEWLNNPLTGEFYNFKKTKDYYFNLSHPAHFYSVLQKYPYLKINFGHFGGYDEWLKHKKQKEENVEFDNWHFYIKELLLKYENTYADISFTALEPSVFSILHEDLQNSILKKKIMYGSDYYLLSKNLDEHEQFKYIDNNFSENEKYYLFHHNPRLFLGE